MKKLATIIASTETFQVEPLQHYVGMLAKHCRVGENRLYQLEMLVEEVFTHIMNDAYQNRPDGEIELTVTDAGAEFKLGFRFRSTRYTDGLEQNKRSDDEIRLSVIQQLSASYQLLFEGEGCYQIMIGLNVDKEK